MSGIAYAWSRLAGALLPAVFVSLLALEAIRPLRRRTRPTLHRLVINLCISALAFAAGVLVVRPVAVAAMQWAAGQRFGLLNLVPMPRPARVALGFLLMDLTFYYWHRANHAVELLWRFHNVHHVDPDLDVSTSFRFHFVEVLYSAAFRAVQVSLIGTSLLIYALYEMVFQICTMFHHSNLRLPIRLERWLNKVFVTPRMHGIHHSAIEQETNSNYSVVFRCWDALHATLRLNVPQADITIGVPAYLRREDNRPWNLLVAPLRKQRSYWYLPNGDKSQRTPAEQPSHPAVLQE